MKKILILLIALVSFVSMTALAVPAQDNEISDKVTKVVDIGNATTIILEVTAFNELDVGTNVDILSAQIQSANVFITVQNSETLFQIP